MSVVFCVVSAGIVKAHRGTIAITSAGEGHGSSFTVILPLAIEETTEGVSPPSGLFNAGASTSILPTPLQVEGQRSIPSRRMRRSQILLSNHQLINPISIRNIPEETDVNVGDCDIRTAETTSIDCNILLVDDSQLNRKMLHRLLKKRFRTVMEAEDGQTALDLVRKSLIREENDPSSIEAIQAVVIDWMMPVMDGVTAVQEMRALGYEGYIIGLTGNVNDADVKIYERAGADVVLTKPLDVKKFDQILDELFRII